MNIYRHNFISACPNNGQQINYALVVFSDHMIHVEKITVACAMWNPAFHEKIADALFEQFPGTFQVLKAHHHGVNIETQRGVPVQFCLDDGAFQTMRAATS